MVTSAVGDNKSMQEEIVTLITTYGDFSEALKWANRFDIPINNRPYCIRDAKKVNER